MASAAYDKFFCFLSLKLIFLAEALQSYQSRLLSHVALWTIHLLRLPGVNFFVFILGDHTNVEIRLGMVGGSGESARALPRGVGGRGGDAQSTDGIQTRIHWPQGRGARTHGGTHAARRAPITSSATATGNGPIWWPQYGPLLPRSVWAQIFQVILQITHSPLKNLEEYYFIYESQDCGISEHVRLRCILWTVHAFHPQHIWSPIGYNFGNQFRMTVDVVVAPQGLGRVSSAHVVHRRRHNHTTIHLDPYIERKPHAGLAMCWALV